MASLSGRHQIGTRCELGPHSELSRIVALEWVHVLLGKGPHLTRQCQFASNTRRSVTKECHTEIGGRPKSSGSQQSGFCKTPQIWHGPFSFLRMITQPKLSCTGMSQATKRWKTHMDPISATDSAAFEENHPTHGPIRPGSIGLAVEEEPV